MAEVLYKLIEFPAEYLHPPDRGFRKCIIRNGCKHFNIADLAILEIDPQQDCADIALAGVAGVVGAVAVFVALPSRGEEKIG